MPSSYDQFCALARGLDLVGERWTLLIVRELTLGPKRYSDIRQALPGIATNLLAERLRKLESAGIVDRRTLPSIGVPVYALSFFGRTLEPVLFELIRWGALLMGPRRKDDSFRPEWLALALRALLERAPADVSLSARVEVEGSDVPLFVRCDDGIVSVDFQPQRTDSDLTVRGSAEGILALFARHPGATPAQRARDVVIRGAPAQRASLRRLLRSQVAPPWDLIPGNSRGVVAQRARPVPPAGSRRGRHAVRSA